MAVTLPKIFILFQQLATSFIQRSERGIALLIVRDATGGGNGYATYGDMTELDEAPYSEANKQYIRDALLYGPRRVGVAKIGAEGTLAEGLALITAHETTGWITVADGTSQDWTALASWIKAREQEQKSYKAVCFNTAAPDSMHVVNLVNENVVFADERGKVTGDKFAPSLCGLLASCNVQRGATNLLCPNLQSVDVPQDPDSVVGAGKFLLVNDDLQVRVGVDVNSLTTTNGITLTEDMKYIETVEAMDMIRDDIAKAFKTEYLGNYRNSLNNQMLLISAINYYLQQISEPAVGILDDQHDNHCFVDVPAQRAAWVGSGKAEAADWDDAKVRSNPFKRNVYLAGDIKILGSMVNFQWIVTLA